MQNENEKPEEPSINPVPAPINPPVAPEYASQPIIPVASPNNTQEAVECPKPQYRPGDMGDVRPLNQRIDTGGEIVEKTKVNYLLISIAIGLLSLIAVVLSFYFNNPNILGYGDKIYLDIAKTCPALKNNISKISIDTIRGQNMVLTNNGDVYFLIGFGSISFSGLKLGDCQKVKELSDVKDINPEFTGATVRFNNNSTKTYNMFLNKGEYFFSGDTYKGTFPLEDNKYKEKVSINNINKYFYLDNRSVLLFVDNKNNIYDSKFNKYIDGSIFDSEILSISNHNNNINMIVTTKNFVYKIKNVKKKSDIKIDGFSDGVLSKYYYTNVGELESKSESFFGIKANEIKQVYFDKHYISEESYYYIVRNDGNFYKFKENIQVTPDIGSLLNSKYSYLIAIPIVLVIIFIGLSYHGDNKKYISGIIKAFITMIVLNIAFRVYGQVLYGGEQILQLFTFETVKNIIIATIIYFNVYYLIKKAIWALMHKAKTKKLLIFTIIYLIIVYIIYIVLIYTLVGIQNKSISISNLLL